MTRSTAGRLDLDAMRGRGRGGARKHLLPLMLTVAWNCRGAVDPSTHFKEGIVFGRLLAEGGAPVAAARASVQLFDPACSAVVPIEGNSEPGFTDGSGRYRVVVAASTTDDTACFRVRAYAPENSGLSSAESPAAYIRLVPRSASAMRDSVRVDLTLPNAP